MKRLNRYSSVLPVSLTAVLFFAAVSQAEAYTTLQELIDDQAEKSAKRMDILKETFQWAPIKLGSVATSIINMSDIQDEWTSYQAAHQKVISFQSSQKPQNGVALTSNLTQIQQLYRLWQAENRIRWVFMRDAAVGLLGIGKTGLLLVWVPFLVWNRLHKRQISKAPTQARLTVLPDRPLDFQAPRADPKGTRLYQMVEMKGCLSPLSQKILACFAASPDHPASLQDHLNLPGGLIEHTARTIEAIVKLAEDRPEEEQKLHVLMALCHDLGKLFAYERVNGQWIDRRLAHDRISALMMAGIPECYTELSAIHREALLLAVRYYHNPEELPTVAPPLSYALLESMHKADAIAYEQEKQLGLQQAEEVKPYLWTAFCRAVPQLNINRHKGGYPEGFTSGETVFVLEHALRERTLIHLPQELQQKLPIRRPSGKLHPAWPLLVEILKERNLLVEQIKGRKTNPSALFNITASGTTYKCVVALSLEELTKSFSGPVAQWIQCPPYEVQIGGGRYGE